MAGELQIPDTIGNFASAASRILPLIFGSGTTTTKTSADTSGLQNVFNTATANSTDTSKTTDLVNNILRQAAINFGPITGASKTAGLYNSSTLKQLSDESQAEATGAASGAVLNYQTQQQQIAAQAAQGIANANKTQTSVTAPAIPPALSTALSVAGLAKSAYSNAGSIKKFLGLGDGSDETSAVGDSTFTSDPFEGAGSFGSPASFTPDSFITSAANGTDPGLAALDSGNAALGITSSSGATSATSAVTDGTTDLLGTGEGVANTAGQAAVDTGAAAGASAANASEGAIDTGAGISNAQGSIPLSSGADIGADLTTDSGADTASSIDDAADLTADTGADAATDASADAATDVGTDVGADFIPGVQAVALAHTGLNLIDPHENIPLHEQFNDILQPVYDGFNSVVDAAGGAIGDVASGVGDVASGVGDAIGDAAGAVTSASVVCTEAVRQGLLSHDLASEELQKNLKRLSTTTLAGYQWLAIPFVRKMRVDLGWALFLSAWAEAYCNEIVTSKGGFVGKFTRYVGEPLCYCIGVLLAFRGMKIDINKELYNG